MNTDRQAKGQTAAAGGRRRGVNRAPVPHDLAKAFNKICAFHGPSRYEKYLDGAVNGATACMQARDAWPDSGDDLDGHGSVWAWFVGSPRAFLFGFARSSQSAIRKMRRIGKQEWEWTQHQLGASQ